MSNISVRDLMTENVASLTPDDSLGALFDLMSDKNIRHVPIVSEDGEVLGLVSHRDLVSSIMPIEPELPLSQRRQMLENMCIKDIMTEGVETTEPEADIISAAQTMLENKLGCLPVAENGHLEGILTESDFVRYVADRASEL